MAKQDDGDNPEQQVGWSIDKGNKRPTNQDSLATVNVNQASEENARSVGIYAVADGVGGGHAGERASKLAVRTAVRELISDLTVNDDDDHGELGDGADDDLPDHYRQWLHHAVEVANRAVYRENQQQQAGPMATTLVMAVVAGERAHIVNVGDSRAYQVTAEGLHQLTRDHSFAEELRAAGLIDRAAAERHPGRHQLTKAVGTDADASEDQFSVKLDQDSLLLLCSDGLFDELDERRIWELAWNAATPQAGCEALTEAAKAAGGSDNIAVVLVRLGRDGLKS